MSIEENVDCLLHTLRERIKEIEEPQIEIANIRSESCAFKIHSTKATNHELVIQEIEQI